MTWAHSERPLRSAHPYNPRVRFSWRHVTAVLILIWLVAVVRLMIADVWDETNAIVAFGAESWTTGEAVRFVLTQSMGIWRPLPSAFAVLVIRAIDNPDVAWRVMRGLNIVLVLTSLWLFIRALTVWNGVSPRRDAVFTLAFLYSAGAVICAGWFANIFDAWVLALTALGVLLIARERHIAAGLAFGVAFFCKETAALTLPLIGLLWAMRRIDTRAALKSGIPATILGAIYFFLRGRIIPLGSASDTHGFAPIEFPPTLMHIAESFWRQTMWSDGPGFLGYLFFLVPFVALRSWRSRAAYALFLLGTTAIYWQMFSTYQAGVLMHYLIFVGRLFLIPAAITLFAVALDRREWAIAILAIPLFCGAVVTYLRYEKFQRAYARIYASAPLRVHYPMKPLNDPRRKIEIGDFPDAPWILDPKTGALLRR